MNPLKSVMNPLKWSKREKFVAVAAGLPIVVGSVVLFHYLFPLHTYLGAVLFGGLFGGLGLLVEMLAV